MLNKPFENKLSGIEVITIEEHSPVGELLPVKAVLSNSVNKLNLGYIRGEKTTNATSMFCHEGITFFTNLHGLKSFIYSQAKPSQAKPSQAKPSQAKPSQAKPSQAKPSQAGVHCLPRRDLSETSTRKLEPP